MGSGTSWQPPAAISTRRQDRRRYKMKASLQKAEVDFDRGGYSYRFAVFKAGLKLPFFDSFDSFFVQAQAEASYYFGIHGVALSVHHDLKNHYALMLRLAGFFRIFGFHLADQCRLRDTVAGAIDSIA